MNAAIMYYQYVRSCEEKGEEPMKYPTWLYKAYFINTR